MITIIYTVETIIVTTSVITIAWEKFTTIILITTYTFSVFFLILHSVVKNTYNNKK